MPPRWWKVFRQQFPASRRRRQPAGCPGGAKTRLYLEALEDRTLLNGGPIIDPLPPPSGSFQVTVPLAADVAGNAVKVKVTALDGSGHVLTSYRGQVNLVSSDGQAVLPGVYTFTAQDAGSHTFAVTPETAGLQFINVVDPGLGSGSAALFVQAASPDHLAFSAQPTAATVGTVLDPAVTVAIEDHYGNVVTSDNKDQATLSLAKNPGAASLHGPVKVTVNAGSAIFDGLSLDRAGSGYSLSASGAKLAAISSQPFDVTPTYLDTTFGKGGKVVTPFGSSTVSAVVLTPDGKVVVEGVTSSGSLGAVWLARYRSDGSLDSSFGGHGMLLTDVRQNGYLPPSLVLAPGGMVLVAASSTTSTGGSPTPLLSTPSSTTIVTVERYKSDGSLDSSFGTGGKLVANLGQSSLQDLAVQPDGKLILVTISASPSQGPGFGSGIVVLARYNSDGSLDSSFGTGGLLIPNLGGNSFQSLTVLPDGKFVVASDGSNFSLALPQSVAVLARYNRDGSLDKTFGTGGQMTLNLGQGSLVGLAFAPDGKVVAVTSNLAGPTPSTMLARFNANGSPDLSFGSNGQVATDSGVGGLQELTVLPNGKIVVASLTETGLGPTSLLSRYNTNGTLDTTFGTGGKLRANLGPDVLTSQLAVQSDGRIVLAGASLALGDGPAALVLARYLGDNWSPTVSAGGPYTVTVGGTLALNASHSADPDGETLSYSWDVNGDGIFRDATGVSPTLTWAQLQALGVAHAGTSFNVRVRVDDGHGHVVDSAAVQVTINPAPSKPAAAKS